MEIEWIPGKSDEHTKAVDKMAKKAAQSPLKARRLDHPRVRKKWSSHKSHRGAITLRGQQELIRLVTDVSMTRHRHMFHYIYEVVDDASPDFQMVDYAYSEIMLRAGHIYRVRFNDETRNPRIVEADEIERDSAAGRYIAISCGQRDPVDSEAAKSPSPNKEIDPLFVKGDRVLKEHKIGLVRSMVATSDGTFVYKVLWDGYDVPDYVMQEALEPSAES